jgi:hypothetical protein
MLYRMGRRLIEAGTLLATVLSAALLALLLAAPMLPQPSAALPPLASTTPRPSGPAATPAEALPPMGLFLMRTPFSFGPCLALELAPQSYPTAEGAEGVATVYWWQRGMTGCDTRTGDVETVDARTHVVPSDDGPDAPPIGYTVEFSVPGWDVFGPPGGPAIRSSLTILARQSTDTLLQAVEDAPQTGQGYVLDRVPGIDPPLDPLPSPTPPTTGGPSGLYLLRGPLDGTGPCIVLELGSAADPPEGTDAVASARWWNPANDDPADPAACYGRSGDVASSPATLTPVVPGADPNLPPVAFRVEVSVVATGTGQPIDLVLELPPGDHPPDEVVATVVSPRGVGSVTLDRVDAIDPPLAP